MRSLWPLLRFAVLLSLFSMAGVVVNGQEIVKVVGERWKFFLRSDGVLLGYGRNEYNEVSPVSGAVSTPVELKLGRKVVDVATSERAVFVVFDDGTVWSWGHGRGNELGTGSQTDSKVPVQIRGLSDVVQIVADGYNALALTRDGAVFAWGTRGNGAIGDGKKPQAYGESGPPAMTPVRVPNVANIKQISFGGGAVLALTNDGRILSWGSNSYGMLGRPPRQELAIDKAGEVVGLRDVVMVAAGSGVSTALKRDGTVWVWGSNYQGQFGNGDRDGTVGMNVGWYLEPRQVLGVSNVVKIAVGLNGRHTLALLRDGTLRGWGNTDWGQLGGGVSATFQLTPMIPRITGVRSIFAAGNNSFAVKKDGTFWAWGIGRPDEWPLKANTKVPVQIQFP